MAPRVPAAPILLLAVSLLLVAGCGRQGLHPTATVSPARDAAPSLLARPPLDGSGAPESSRGLFYPLEIGNHWRYGGTFSLVIVPFVGDPGPPIVLRSTKDARLMSTVTFGERQYVQEEDVTREEWASDSITQHIYWRQDRTGLYEADVPLDRAHLAGLATRGAGASAVERAWSRLEAPLADPATREAFRGARERLEQKLALLQGALRAPARPLGEDPPAPGELTRLRYPLHPGAQWVIRLDPLFAARVEGMEPLDLPAGRFDGWRMRYESELFGPQDRVHVWYGRDGYLGLEAHLEAVAVDVDNNPVGTVIAEQSERLEAIELVGPGPR